MVAALKTGRNSIGIELDTEYCGWRPPPHARKRSLFRAPTPNPHASAPTVAPATLERNLAAQAVMQETAPLIAFVKAKGGGKAGRQVKQSPLRGRAEAVKLEHPARRGLKKQPERFGAPRARGRGPSAHRAGLTGAQAARAASPDIGPRTVPIFRAFFRLTLRRGRFRLPREWESGNILGPPGEGWGGAREFGSFPGCECTKQTMADP